MKNDSRFSQEVKIAKDKSAKWDVKNPHAVDNVNVAQGPRTGNSNPGGKRGEFISNKKERSGLADPILKAYGDRNEPMTIDPRLEGIRPNVKPKKFSR